VAFKEWTEKRDLVEFCERNFQSLYDTVLRTNCGEGKDQVLSYVAEAWKNLRQYTKHMYLFPEAPPPHPLLASSADGLVVAKANDRQSPSMAGGPGVASSSPTGRSPERSHYGGPAQTSSGGKTGEDERHMQQGEGFNGPMRHAMPPQQQHFHQPSHQFQQPAAQQQVQQHKRPSTSSPSSQDAPLLHSMPSQGPSFSGLPSHFAIPPPYPPSVSYGGPPPQLASFSGGSSSLSLSWLNSMAFSMNGSRTPTLPSPTPLSGPNAALGGPFQQGFSSDVGNRGSLEGLEYRSFEWKGVFE
jgi:hypothetical protein